MALSLLIDICKPKALSLFVRWRNAKASLIALTGDIVKQVDN
jgi:hypothetical protein